MSSLLLGRSGWRILGCAACALGLLSACHHDQKEQFAPAPTTAEKIVFIPREGYLPAYPCSSCHATRKPNPTPRHLVKFHVLRNEHFNHGAKQFWCYQCHSIKNIDMLRTAAGKLVTFNQAWRVCVSCHGDKLADYQEGIHGRSTGYWDGEKFRRSCPSCHNPHNPRFPAIKPQHAPPRPRGQKPI